MDSLMINLENDLCGLKAIRFAMKLATFKIGYRLFNDWYKNRPGKRFLSFFTEFYKT